MSSNAYETEQNFLLQASFCLAIEYWSNSNTQVKNKEMKEGERDGWKKNCMREEKKKQSTVSTGNYCHVTVDFEGKIGKAWVWIQSVYMFVVNLNTYIF